MAYRERFHTLFDGGSGSGDGNDTSGEVEVDAGWWCTYFQIGADIDGGTCTLYYKQTASAEARVIGALDTTKSEAFLIGKGVVYAAIAGAGSPTIKLDIARGQ